jgi:uncharacterized protein
MTPPTVLDPSIVRARLLGVAVVAVALLAGCVGDGDDGVPALHPRIDDWPQTRVEVVADGDEHEVAALVASTPERRQRGLQEVEHLPDGAGMLFLFDRDRTSGFWMKDTLVPLEIAFATANGEVVEVLSMEPCEEDPCETYAPQGPYRAALEVPDGWLSERGVGPGAQLSWGEVPEAR